MKISFGPSGVGPVKEIIDNLNKFNKLGLKACEVPFTYGIYIKENEAREIGEVVKKLGIKMSIHAPYYVNLNSEEKKKLFLSKKRILDCCKIGHLLHAEKIVIHSGFYMKKSPEETYENIKNQIIELMEKIKEEKWNVELAPEIMGKKNVFGSIDEISRLSKDTGCSFTIDFAHILARYGKYDFKKVIESFPQKKWHCHFSGIDFGEKGEKKHLSTSSANWEDLFKGIKGLDKDITIINESPFPLEDSLRGLEFYSKVKF